MKGLLIFLGVIFLVVAIAFLVIGQVWVAQGKKGTWGIWPMYIVHGVSALMALVLFYVANTRYGAAKPPGVNGEES
jgi:hypothetical protein